MSRKHQQHSPEPMKQGQEALVKERSRTPSFDADAEGSAQEQSASGAALPPAEQRQADGDSRRDIARPWDPRDRRRL